MSGFSASLRPGRDLGLSEVTFKWHTGPQPMHSGPVDEARIYRGCCCGGLNGMAHHTHTRHRVLILDDDLSQEPSLIVLVHGGRGGARSLW